jgi:hypothetical protein
MTQELLLLLLLVTFLKVDYKKLHVMNDIFNVI